MIIRVSAVPALPRASGMAVVLALGLALSGCADMNDSFTQAFADPAKYDLYDCKQLETARKSLNARATELQGLMAKAQTGTGGMIVSELAYRNDYISTRGQIRFAEEAWRKNRCHETLAPASAAPAPGAGMPAVPAAPATAKPVPLSRSGSSVY